MTNYAVVATGGKQYVVRVGETILVDKLNIEKGKSYIFPQVLLVRSDEEVLIGSPVVENVQVKGKVLDTVKGEKVTTSKFKAKVHYRRKIGFRHKYSQILIESITTEGKTKSVTKKAKTASRSKG